MPYNPKTKNDMLELGNFIPDFTAPDQDGNIVSSAELLGKKTVFVSVPSALACFAANVLYYLSLKKVDYREKVQRLCEPRTFTHEEASEALSS